MMWTSMLMLTLTLNVKVQQQHAAEKALCSVQCNVQRNVHAGKRLSETHSSLTQHDPDPKDGNRARQTRDNTDLA